MAFCPPANSPITRYWEMSCMHIQCICYDISVGLFFTNGGTKAMGLSSQTCRLPPPPTVKHNWWRIRRGIVRKFKFWSILQSKSVNNVWKLLQLLGDCLPDRLPGLHPGAPVGDFRLPDLWATTPIKISGAATLRYIRILCRNDWTYVIKRFVPPRSPLSLLLKEKQHLTLHRRCIVVDRWKGK